MNIDLVLADSVLSGAAPRYTPYIRGLDRASKDLVPSERAILRSFSGEITIPTIEHVQAPGVSFYSGLKRYAGSNPLSTVYMYRPLVAEGQFTWLSGDDYSTWIMTSGEGEYITEDPKWFKTIVQGGARCQTISATEYQLASTPTSGFPIMVITSGTVLAKTILSQPALFQVNNTAYSIGFDTDKEAVVKKFRFNHLESAEGCYYRFDQGKNLTLSGWHAPEMSAILKLYIYPGVSGTAATSNMSGSILVSQFYDEVDFSMFDRVAGTRYGNGYVLGDLYSKPVEKVSIDTSTVRIAQASTTYPNSFKTAGFVSAKNPSNNAIIFVRGKEDVATDYFNSTLNYQHSTPNTIYKKFKIDSSTFYSMPDAVSVPSYAPNCGSNDSSMVVFGGGGGAITDYNENPTDINGVKIYSLSTIENFSFATELVTTSEATLGLSSVSRSYESANFTIFDTTYVLGGLSKHVHGGSSSRFKEYNHGIGSFNISTYVDSEKSAELGSARGSATLLKAKNQTVVLVGGRGPACQVGTRSIGVVDVLERYNYGTDTIAYDTPPCLPVAAPTSSQNQEKGYVCGGTTNYSGALDYSFGMINGRIDTNIVQQTHFATGTWSIADALMINNLAYSSASYG